MWAIQLNSSHTTTTIDTMSSGIKKSCKMNVEVGASTGGNAGPCSGGPFGSEGAAADEGGMKTPTARGATFSVSLSSKASKGIAGRTWRRKSRR